MGLFYVDTSAENSLSNQKKHKEMIKEFAKESINIGKLSTPDIFPDFLWKPQMNDHEGDDYKLRATCNNPNILKAYQIRRKYPNYWDYVDALEAYYDYIDYLESAYGSFDMLKNAADNGMSLVYIPKKPKLTNKKSNKNLMRSGFTPSRILEEFEVDEDLIDAAIDMIKNNEVASIEEDESYKLPKSIRKLHDREIGSKIKTERINSIYAQTSSGTTLQGMDAIISFMNNPNIDEVEDRGKIGDSFTEDMVNLHEFDYVPRDVIDDMFMPRASCITSGFLETPEKKNQKIILETLTEEGFNFLGEATTRGMDKEAVRAVTRKYEGSIDYNTEGLTEKQIRKLKKKEAKRRKRSQERLIGDRRLQDVLLRNRAHFSMDDSLNFRLQDVIPED